jgi:hypothetical protein
VGIRTPTQYAAAIYRIVTQHRGLYIPGLCSKFG